MAAGYSDADYKAPRGCVPANKTKRRWLFFGVPIGLVIVAAIAIGAAVGASKSKQDSTVAPAGAANGTSTTRRSTRTSTSAKASATSAAPVANNFGVAGSGADGSTVEMAEGGSFTYSNSFGGTWAVDPANPYSVSRIHSSSNMADQ